MRKFLYPAAAAVTFFLFTACSSGEGVQDQSSLAKPDSTRFTRIVLVQELDEPMTMGILSDNSVLFVERKGAVKLYDAPSGELRTVATLNVFSGIEDGLLGLALDPGFEKNNWVYLYYAPAGSKPVNRLSRFEFRDKQLILESEKIMLEIPTQRQYCCHSAGSIAFGPDGLLYLATGDNTNAEEAEGYVPIDERPGHELADDQATAANTNDLRGKILRIKPEADGTYSIPEGNLFPEGTPNTRPEIYVMGSRNPYRISVDPKSGFLYWGDVGPDTKVPGEDGGFMSYDEINQAREPGFYGWPYFLGDNQAFPDYDFETKKEGPRFDPENPVNLSPNNTGLKELPKPRPAMIWYGKGPSSRFPLVGKGGASAMAGPVYHSDLFKGAPYKLPRYYDGKLFIYEWIRRWIIAVTLDEEGNYVSMEPFLDHMDFNAPVDMKFGPDGALYVLEYGTNWFAKNSNARLVRIEYAEGNRNPTASIRCDSLYGTAPFTVQFSGEASSDPDEGDRLGYSWTIEGKELSGSRLEYTFAQNGSYPVVLTVSDQHGGKASSTITVKVGNTPPEVIISSKSNKSFYWPGTPFDYKVEVRDREDGEVSPEQVKVSFDYLPNRNDLAVALSDSERGGSLRYLRGAGLLQSLDCKSCHTENEASVGPSYRMIAQRYAAEQPVERLARKVIEGGSGNWGERPMTPHPGMDPADAEEMVRYILSLEAGEERLALEGSLQPKAQKQSAARPASAHGLSDEAGAPSGLYLLTASYTDQGAGGIEPLAARAHVALKAPLVQLEDYDEGNVSLGTITTAFLTYGAARHDRYAMFRDIDLTHIKELRYRVKPLPAGGRIELRLGAPDGALVSTLTVPSAEAGDPKQGWKEMRAAVEPSEGIHDLYFVFVNQEAEQQALFNLDWIYFSNLK